MTPREQIEELEQMAQDLQADPVACGLVCRHCGIESPTIPWGDRLELIDQMEAHLAMCPRRMVDA